MGIGDKLRKRRQELQITRNQLAEKIHVTPSAIANYENGISYPKPDILISLIMALEVDANYLYQDYLSNNKLQVLYGQVLSPAEEDAVSKYRVLTDQSKRLVRMIIDEEYARNKAEETSEFPCYLPGIRKINSGFILLETPSKINIKHKHILKNMEFCFQIQKDRYEPVFKKYDVLALNKAPAKHNEIGLFRLNDVNYLRILYQTHGVCKLRSLNVIDTDTDIEITENDQFQCIGTVLGRLNGTYDPVAPREIM